MQWDVAGAPTDIGKAVGLACHPHLGQLAKLAELVLQHLQKQTMIFPAARSLADGRGDVAWMDIHSDCMMIWQQAIIMGGREIPRWACAHLLFEAAAEVAHIDCSVFICVRGHGRREPWSVSCQTI